MTEDGSAASRSPGERRRLGCLHYLFYGVAWLFVYGCVLGIGATLGTRYYLNANSGVEGYGAYVSLVGYMLVMPVGFLISAAVFAIWRRLWIALALAAVIAGITAIAPIIVDTIHAS